MLTQLQNERAEIMNNLKKVRADIKKYEALLKPKIPKQPPIVDVENVEEPVSDSDSL